jgi:hypothetical protein
MQHVAKFLNDFVDIATAILDSYVIDKSNALSTTFPDSFVQKTCVNQKKEQRYRETQGNAKIYVDKFCVLIINDQSSSLPTEEIICRVSRDFWVFLIRQDLQEYVFRMIVNMLLISMAKTKVINSIANCSQCGSPALQLYQHKLITSIKLIFKCIVSCKRSQLFLDSLVKYFI